MKVYLIQFSAIAMIFISSNALAEFQCSKGELKIFYINGISTDPGEHGVTAKSIDKIVASTFKLTDFDRRISFEGIHNQSRELFNDLHELKAGFEELRSPGKKSEYWKEMARREVAKLEKLPAFAPHMNAIKKKVDEAFIQIYKKKYKVDPITDVVNRMEFTDKDFYHVLNGMSTGLRNILENAAVSEEVINFTSTKIKNAYKNGNNKIIGIAHSQGNIVLQNALARVHFRDEYPIDSEKASKEWFMNLTGNIQMASPGPDLISSNSQHIRLDIDKVINGSYFITDVDALYANYKYDPEITTFFDLTLNRGGAWEIFFKVAGYNHGIDSFYLSDSVKAMREGSSSSKSMLEHFQNNLIEVAEKLSSNCPTDVKVTGAQCAVEKNHSTNIYRSTGQLNTLYFNSVGEYLPIKSMPDSDCYTSSDDGRLNELLYHCHSDKVNPSINLKFETIGNNALTKTITNPCLPQRTFPQSGFISLIN